MSAVTFEQVTKRFAGDVVAVDHLDLEVDDGELLVVVGPSGCGKTTTLRMLAGLEDVTEGAISIGDRVVNDVGAKDRDIAMVFQSYALYPHLTVAENLGYPLKLARMPKGERNDRIRQVADQLQLTELLGRRPRQLSGGQRQRVAMGRAMVRQPSVFLMDEPLSNLDAKLRVTMRSEVAELQRQLGTTMFYVTHDQIEAMTMGHRVALLRDGLLQQVAPPVELYRSPANVFVAGFIGSPPMNLIDAMVGASEDGGVRLRSGGATFELTGAEPGPSWPTIHPVVAGVRPEHVSIVAPEEGTPATVRLVEMVGSEHLIHLDIDGLAIHRADRPDEVTTPHEQRLLVKIHDEPTGLRPGAVVGLRLAGADVHLFDATTGAALAPAPVPA